MFVPRCSSSTKGAFNKILERYDKYFLEKNDNDYFMEVGAETVSGSDEVFEEPRFDFDCTYSYGRFRAPIPPLNRHFVPRLAKLKVHYRPTKMAKTKMYVRHMAENQSRFIKHGERCSMT